MSGCFNTVFPKEIDEFLSGPKLAKDGHVELDSIFSQDPKVKIDVENPLLDSEKLSRQAIKEGKFFSTLTISKEQFSMNSLLFLLVSRQKLYLFLGRIYQNRKPKK